MRYLIYIAALFLMAPYAWANMDSGLYDPAPPEGSAFIRFLGERTMSGSLQAKANNKGYDYLSYKDVTSYYVVPQGPVEAQVGDATASFNAEAGKFYTVIFNDTKTLDVKTDPQNKNQAKSQIVFYNLSGGKSLSLKTSDGKVEIIPVLAPGAVGERQINPVKVSLAVYEGNNIVKDLGSVSLERAKSYSVVMLNDNDVRLVPSLTNTTR